MSDFDVLAARMREQGEGEWELHVGDETVTAHLDDVAISDEQGFTADGTDEEGRPVRLTTGVQPGGPVELQRRESAADEWESVGELDDAVKQV